MSGVLFIEFTDSARGKWRRKKNTGEKIKMQRIGRGVYITCKILFFPPPTDHFFPPYMKGNFSKLFEKRTNNLGK